MLYATVGKSTSPAALREVENEFRTMKAAGGQAPNPLSLLYYYMASELGWKACLKAGYIQLYGALPSGAGAAAERVRHCQWYWDHQETEANKKAMIAAHVKYEQDHYRLWADEREAIETPTGDLLSAVDRQT
jgi:hypothetical protein